MTMPAEVLLSQLAAERGAGAGMETGAVLGSAVVRADPAALALSLAAVRCAAVLTALPLELQQALQEQFTETQGRAG